MELIMNRFLAKYEISVEEKEKIIAGIFSSVSPLILKNLSSKERKKVVILERIADEFEPERIYTEKEINAILRPIYEDFVLLRRSLIDYKFLQRSDDCSSYWKSDE